MQKVTMVILAGLKKGWNNQWFGRLGSSQEPGRLLPLFRYYKYVDVVSLGLFFAGQVGVCWATFAEWKRVANRLRHRVK